MAVMGMGQVVYQYHMTRIITIHKIPAMTCWVPFGYRLLLTQNSQSASEQFAIDLKAIEILMYRDDIKLYKNPCTSH